MNRLTPIEGSVAAMAEMSRHDRSIGVDDILNHALNVHALHDWAAGDVFDTEGTKAKLLDLYPHLRDR